MNREQTKKAIEVMQAYVDGGEVGRDLKGRHQDYEHIFDPTWDFDNDPEKYIISPEPREFVIWNMSDGQLGVMAAERYEKAQGSFHDAIKVREVLDD